MPLYDDCRQLEDLRRTAEAFRVAAIESGALHKVPQDRTIDQLRALEAALSRNNYLIFDPGGSTDQLLSLATYIRSSNPPRIIGDLHHPNRELSPACAMQMANALEAWSIIEQLRAPEGAEVRLFCDNPEFGTGANNALEVCDDWTGWWGVRFEGDTLLEALRVALQASKGKVTTRG